MDSGHVGTDQQRDPPDQGQQHDTAQHNMVRAADSGRGPPAPIHGFSTQLTVTNMDISFHSTLLSSNSLLQQSQVEQSLSQRERQLKKTRSSSKHRTSQTHLEQQVQVAPLPQC